MQSKSTEQTPAVPAPEVGPSGRTKLIVVASIILIAVAVIFFSPLREYVDPKRAATWLKSVGNIWWAPAVFILFYCIFNVLLVPATILSLTAGAVWGWWKGGLWVLVASTIASAIPFFLARSTGSAWIETLVRKRASGLYEKLHNEGFITLLLLRLVPIAPYNILNYAAGLAGIRTRHYLIATFIGTIPGIFIFTYLADSIAAGVISPGQAFVRILVAGVFLAALALISRFLAGRVRKRLEKHH